MPPRKKRSASPGSSASRGKKLRRTARQDPLATRVKPSVDTEALTVLNSTESPLLRLPLELRDVIFELAYGSQTLHPSIDERRKSKGTLTILTCQFPKPCREVYEQSKEGAREGLNYKYKNRELSEWSRNCNMCKSGAPFKIPLVSKQFFGEAVVAAHKHNLFSFGTAKDIEGFMVSTSVYPELIKSIFITLGWHSTEALRFTHVLTPSFVGLLRGLQEVHFTLNSLPYYYYDEDPTCQYLSTHDELDYKHNPRMWPKRFKMLPDILPSFQQLRLKPENVTAYMHQEWAVDEHTPGWRRWLTVTDMRKISEEVRKMILDYHERRVSNRIRDNGGGALRMRTDLQATKVLCYPNFTMRH